MFPLCIPGHAGVMKPFIDGHLLQAENQSLWDI